MTTLNRDSAWVMRTYSGHSSARASNQLYRANLAKGQTGLSVAFDLPTQTGYDSDHPLASAEVGKVGVPIAHIEDMAALFDQIPLDKMNTSMTINATAAWLLALYIAVAERQGASIEKLAGTTQNDILKEYLSRGTYIFPPEASLRLTTDVINYTVRHMPQWNPVNVCPYHLQEAGATPVQELAYGLANAVCFLDAVKRSGEVEGEAFDKAVGRISFFLDAGIRFVEEICKIRAFVKMWDQITAERYDIKNEKYRRFRYGVQVNSLGLTEHQPENNVPRILYEMLGVTLSRDARARAIQLPCWNEALGLPRPWDQQWSLRMQQILAFETDLLEYEDIFAGSRVIEAKTQSLIEAAQAELQKILAQGGSIAALEYMKQQLVLANAQRLRAIETGEVKVVGVNCFAETAESPLTRADDLSILKIDEAAVRHQIESLQAFRQRRNAVQIEQALQNLETAARQGQNIMPVSIAAAKAGVTTGEWAQTLRRVFGEYRGPTGVAPATVRSGSDELKQAQIKVKKFYEAYGERLRMLVGKPGLDGHSNGAEQIAVRARDAGIEVIYQGIRLTPDQIVETALQEGVHLIGLSLLSGSHLVLIPEVLEKLQKKGLGHIPLVVGGIIPEPDRRFLLERGVARVYTPKDFEINRIIADIAEEAIQWRKKFTQ